MPSKNKLQKSRRLTTAVGRESMKKIRDEHIQGDFAWLKFLLLNTNKYMLYYIKDVWDWYLYSYIYITYVIALLSKYVIALVIYIIKCTTRI